MSSETQKQTKTKGKSKLMYVLYALMLIGIQGMLASVIIGTIALISNGEIITIGSRDADIIFTSVSIGVLFEELICFYFFLLRQNIRQATLSLEDQAKLEEAVEKGIIAPISIFEKKVEEPAKKEMAEEKQGETNQQGNVPPIPGAKEQGPYAIIPSSHKMTKPLNGPDKKWMSHTRLSANKEKGESK